MIQVTRCNIAPILTSIFHSCLHLAYVPKTWRRVKVVFIPKAGRNGHQNAKDYRPISLTSFLLKTFERVLEIHIRNKLEQLPISNAQHAYRGGRSTETALHEVVRTVELSMRYGEYTLAAFLDIKGAFNDVSVGSICCALERSGIQGTVVRWIRSMLMNRIVTGELCSDRITRQVGRGTPQGGVLSPILWIAVMDTLLKEFATGGTKVVAYADDVVLLVSGKFLSTISEIMTRSLGRVVRWSATCGLGINPSKTELMLFTKRTKIPVFTLPKLVGHELQLSPKVKYLGVVLDSRLNWRANVEERTKKAALAFYSCRRMLGRTWGLRPSLALWIFKAVVRPILTYGCIVWWPAMRKKYNVETLMKVQRSASIMVTGALRTCPGAALNVLLHLLPADLFVMYRAGCGAARLRAVGLWRDTSYGHGMILGELGLPETVDYKLPTVDFEPVCDSLIPSRRWWRRNRCVDEGDEVHFYTDGSMADGRVGAGIFCRRLGVRKSYRLPDHASVFQAEVYAVQMAAMEAVRSDIVSGIKIFVDNQAAIRALTSKVTTSRLVEECRKSLRSVRERGQVTLLWVPGHRGIEGNEIADELARGGTVLTQQQSTVVLPPMREIRRSLEIAFHNRADNRWRTTTTCSISRRMWPKYDRGRTEALIKLSRRNISRVVAVITGHWTLGRHARYLGIDSNDLCRSCCEDDSEESVAHLFCECPAFCRSRLKYLGAPTFGDLSEIADITPSRIVQFLNVAEWL